MGSAERKRCSAKAFSEVETSVGRAQLEVFQWREGGGISGKDLRPDRRKRRSLPGFYKHLRTQSEG
jgi:hypothetical protein